MAIRKNKWKLPISWKYSRFLISSSRWVSFECYCFYHKGRNFLARCCLSDKKFSERRQIGRRDVDRRLWKKKRVKRMADSTPMVGRVWPGSSRLFWHEYTSSAFIRVFLSLEQPRFLLFLGLACLQPRTRFFPSKADKIAGELDDYACRNQRGRHLDNCKLPFASFESHLALGIVHF